MPLAHTFEPEAACIAGIWHIAEDEAQLRSLLQCSTDMAELESIRVPSRRLAWLAARVLCQHLAALHRWELTGIHKDQFGKPQPEGHIYALSFSHTDSYATAVLHRYCRVGIDMEYTQRPMQQVLPRVLNTAELGQANTPERQALYWCAKEALYKLYGKRTLDFRTDMEIIEPWPGKMQGRVIKNEQSHQTKIYAKHYRQYMIALAIADQTS